jgi:hypothetical protein
MALKRCLDCFRWATPGKSRCTEHDRARDGARGTSTQRGYGWQHQQAKAHDEQETTPDDPCPKCGLPLGPPPWDQGHTKDRAGYEGPTHIRCNRATARRR